MGVEVDQLHHHEDGKRLCGEVDKEKERIYGGYSAERPCGRTRCELMK